MDCDPQPFLLRVWVVLPRNSERGGSSLRGSREAVELVNVFGLVCLIDWISAFNGRKRGFGLAVLYSIAYSTAISQMTYESGGFASGYYVGLLALAVAVFVVFQWTSGAGRQYWP